MIILMDNIIDLISLFPLTIVKKDVPFETERDLKKRGTSKTPDILFSCPVAVKVPKVKSKRNKPYIIVDDEEDFDWKMICWIDSKVIQIILSIYHKNIQTWC